MTIVNQQRFTCKCSRKNTMKAGLLKCGCGRIHEIQNTYGTVLKVVKTIEKGKKK